jgi:hypothetical protein
MSSRCQLIYGIPPTWDLGEAVTPNRKKINFLERVQNFLSLFVKKAIKNGICTSR